MKIRDALEYYADPRVYQEGIITPDSGVPYTVRAVLLDGGQEAREALAALDDQEAMRGAFEVWNRGEGAGCREDNEIEEALRWDSELGEYQHATTDYDWRIWQAAHRRLGVKDA